MRVSALFAICILALGATTSTAQPAGTDAGAAAIACGPGIVDTTHFRHSFSRRLEYPTYAMPHPYAVGAGSPCGDVPRFVLATAYYFEVAWARYEAALAAIGHRMPQPTAGRLPVTYLASNPGKPLQFVHGSGPSLARAQVLSYAEGIRVSLSPGILDTERHKARTAHEVFHFIQSHHVGGEKCSGGPGLWWIEAAADYAATAIVWPDLAGYRGGGDFRVEAGEKNGNQRAFPYLLESPLQATGVPPNRHGIAGFAEKWGQGEELEYDKAHFIQFLVEKYRVPFLRLNAALLDAYQAGDGPQVILDALAKQLAPNGPLRDVYAEFATWWLVSERSPVSNTLVTKLALTEFPAVPLDAAIKPCPACRERTAFQAGRADIVSPTTVAVAMPAGFSAILWAMELKPELLAATPPGERLLTVGTRALEHGIVRIVVGPSRTWLAAAPKPVAEFTGAHQRTPVRLAAGQTMYVMAIGNSLDAPGSATITISDGPALTISPAAFSAPGPQVPFDATATLVNSPSPVVPGGRPRNRSGDPQAATFRWRLRTLKSGRIQEVAVESKAPQAETGVAASRQSITFPAPGSYVVTCIAQDANGDTIAESLPVPCEVAAPPLEPEPAPGTSAAPGAKGSTPRTGAVGYWRLVETRSLERARTPGTTGRTAVSDGSIAGSETSTGPDGPATWAGDCTWSLSTPGGLARLVPGQVVDVSMTVRERSVPEKLSGWNHGATGITGTVRFDKPGQGFGITHASASELVSADAKWQKSNPTPSATNTRSWTVPPGPGPADWGDRAALNANCSFGRFERVYEWTRGPAPASASAEPPPTHVPLTGNWTGTWTNALGERGRDTLELREAADGTLTGVWSGNITVTGRRLGPSTIELAGRNNNRAYEVSGVLQGGTLTFTYTTRRLDGRGTYRGTSTLTRER